MSLHTGSRRCLSTFRSAEYDPEEAGPILAEKQLKFPLLEKYPTDNGSKEPTLP